MKSRESSDPSSASPAKRRQRAAMRAALATATVTTNVERICTSVGRFSKACTEVITPERVTQVATSVSQKVAAARHSVQRLNTPRLTERLAECSSAVAVSQGMSDVLSTGSQPQ